jgi:hypothetical protein
MNQAECQKLELMGSEIDNLIDRFRSAAIEKGDFASGTTDSQLYDVMRDSFHRLRGLGEVGHEALLRLLEDESDHVRCWVAAALLVEGDLKARNVLETIANTGAGMLRFNAEVTLREFDKGTLGTPFPSEK